MDRTTLKFAKTHEWVALSGDVATVGISDFAVRQLTDLVYIDLPKVGRSVAVGGAIGEVESVKAVSDLYAPVAGEVVEVNSALSDDLGLLSDDPFGRGWIAKIRVPAGSTLDHLLGWPDYEQHCAAEAH